MKCERCGKTLTKKMKLEYSVEMGELYCSFGCGVDRLLDHYRMMSIDYETAKLKKEC